MCKENFLLKYVSRLYSLDVRIIFLIRLHDPFVLDLSFLDLFEVLSCVIISRHANVLKVFFYISFS